MQGGAGSIPGRGIKIPHASGLKKKERKKERWPRNIESSPLAVPSKTRHPRAYSSEGILKNFVARLKNRNLLNLVFYISIFPPMLFSFSLSLVFQGESVSLPASSQYYSEPTQYRKP